MTLALYLSIWKVSETMVMNSELCLNVGNHICVHSFLILSERWIVFCIRCVLFEYVRLEIWLHLFKAVITVTWDLKAYSEDSIAFIHHAISLILAFRNYNENIPYRSDTFWSSCNDAWHWIYVSILMTVNRLYSFIHLEFHWLFQLITFCWTYKWTMRTFHLYGWNWNRESIDA